MQKEELPSYKQTFLAEMQELRRQQQEQQRQKNLGQTGLSNQPKNPPQVQNNILNTSQYSSPAWRQSLNQTTTGVHHNEGQFNLNLLMNPQIGRKNNNIRSTPISEYSNARHNNTVFINPKNTSC